MIPTERFAIAPPQLPKSDRTPSTPQTSFFNEPQRHRGHRERAIAPFNPPNSDSYGALRYRTPSISQTSFFNEPRRHEEDEGRKEEEERAIA
ncbi:hypothetical protein FJR11_17095 [Anabaena sp. UHCC 0187]|uniref:hypothetical protein n=1 Tax=Anabaena sp. UHCC 0187 TaxID=2590018 RepID=UPI0014457094|nr:hypothetical protein [Anabaena sp. UHCC 0187]MTJ14264.1 hypothetical protein [Anabaena sp. UHCC 0187]